MHCMTVSNMNTFNYLVLRHRLNGSNVGFMLCQYEINILEGWETKPLLLVISFSTAISIHSDHSVPMVSQRGRT